MLLNVSSRRHTEVPPHSLCNRRCISQDVSFPFVLEIIPPYPYLFDSKITLHSSQSFGWSNMAPSGRSKSKEPAKEFKKDQGNSSEQAWAIAAQGFALDVKQAKEWVKSIFKKMDEEQWIITKDREAREERLFTVDEQKKILFLKRWKGFNFFMISLWLNDNGQLAHKVQRSELDYLLDDGDVNEPYDCYEIAAVYVWMSVHRSQLHPEVAELFTASKDLHELPKGEIQVLKYDAQEKKTSEYWVPYMIFLEDVDKWKRHPESGKITVDEFKRKV